MPLSRAAVRTENASKYLQQLCKHWSHKFPTEFDAQKGRVPFASGALLTLEAGPGLLDMILEDATDESLTRMQGVVDNHLKRFAFREELAIDWTRDADAAIPVEALNAANDE